MYAIIKTGGKQYRVAQGDTLKVEMLNSKVGDKVFFEEVLMIGNGDKFQIGAPLLKGAKVQAEVLNQGRGEKIEILKFRRRKHHMKRQGHRQNFTEVKIIGINE